MEKVYDAMLQDIAQRAADLLWERLEPRLKATASHLVTRQEVMEMLKVSETTLWNWEKEGRLKRTATCGRRVYYDLDEVKQQLTKS